MVLDIAGDLLVLVITVILIWKIRINWKQKVALAFTLCLTIVMVIITIARIARLKWKDKLDSVWETYFIVIAAEIGLALVAITAFRALYVSKEKNHLVHTAITSFGWYHKGKSAFMKIITKTPGKTPSNETGSIELDKRSKDFLKNNIPMAI